MTWRSVLRRIRVLRAIEELAAGDRPVTTIAFIVGYGHCLRSTRRSGS
jgi:AraC-like DNA-binding protein